MHRSAEEKKTESMKKKKERQNKGNLRERK